MQRLTLLPTGSLQRLFDAVAGCADHLEVNAKLAPIVEFDARVLRRPGIQHRWNVILGVAGCKQHARNRQNMIDKTLLRENKKRVPHDYKVGDKVLKLVYKPNKLQPKAIGPYEIHTVHYNGTLTITLDANRVERINIRRVKPYIR